MITSTHKLVGAFRLDGKMLQYVLIVGTGSKKIKPIVYHIPSFSHCFIIIVPWFTIIVPWFIMVYHHFHQFRIAMLTYVRLIPTHRQVQIHVLRSCFGDEIFSRSV